MGLFGAGKKDKSAKSEPKQVVLDDGVEYSIAASVDCLGDSCPRPQLMTKKAVGAASPSDMVEVLVDNPTSMEALPPMCPGMSATHMATVQADKGWRVYIRKD